MSDDSAGANGRQKGQSPWQRDHQHIGAGGASFGTAFAVSLAALWWVVVPAASDPAEQAFGGCHMAFAGIFCLVIALAVIIVLFVRDKPGKDAASSAGKENAAK